MKLFFPGTCLPKGYFFPGNLMLIHNLASIIFLHVLVLLWDSDHLQQVQQTVKICKVVRPSSKRSYPSYHGQAWP